MSSWSRLDPIQRKAPYVSIIQPWIYIFALPICGDLNILHLRSVFIKQAGAPATCLRAAAAAAADTFRRTVPLRAGRAVGVRRRARQDHVLHRRHACLQVREVGVQQ